MALEPSNTAAARPHKMGTSQGSTAANLANFSLECGLDEFLHLFWECEPQHIDFLTGKLKETGIVITPWVQTAEGGATTDEGQQQSSFARSVSVLHPLPIQLPWLPLHIQNKCVQKVAHVPASQPRQVVVVERSAVNGIPFVQPYLIVAWSVIERRSGSTSGIDSACVDVEVNISYEYDAYTLLQSQVEFWAGSAMEFYFSEWVPHAQQILQARRANNVLGMGEGDDNGILLRTFMSSAAAEEEVDAIDAGDEEGATWRDAGADDVSSIDQKAPTQQRVDAASPSSVQSSTPQQQQQQAPGPEQEMRLAVEEARKLSAQRPFKTSTTRAESDGDPSGSVLTTVSSSSGGEGSGAKETPDQRRLDARRRNAKIRKAHTPEAPPVANTFACAINFESLFNIPKRASITARPHKPPPPPPPPSDTTSSAAATSGQTGVAMSPL